MSINEKMVPRIGITICDEDGWPILPQVATVTLDGKNFFDAPVWTHYFEGSIGNYPSREYRDDSISQVAVVMKLANVLIPSGSTANITTDTSGALAIAWVPSVDGQNFTYDLLITGPSLAPYVLGQWGMVEQDGMLTLPDLNADSSSIGLIAQNAWPADWRVHLDTDPFILVTGSVDSGMPDYQMPVSGSGPFFIGNCL